MAADQTQVADLALSQTLVATGTAELPTAGFGSVGVTIGGTFTGATFNFEATNNGSRWFPVFAENEDTQAVEHTVFTTGSWSIPCGGKSKVRVNLTTLGTGSAVIDLLGSAGTALVNLGVPENLNSLPTPLNRVNANQSLGVLNATVSFLPIGVATATVVITGTWVGRIQFQGSPDAGTFVPIAVLNAQTREVVTSTTANGVFLVPVGGYAMLLAQMIAYTSGTATVSFAGSLGPQIVHVIGPLNRGRNVKCIGMAATFRIVGNNASPQNLFSLENGGSSAVRVAPREIEVMSDATGAVTAPFIARLSRSTGLPTGGTILTKGLTDTSQSSDSNVIARSGASADGTNSALTATAGTTLHEEFIDRPHTLVGYFALEPIQLLPGIARGAANDPLTLQPGEAFLVQVVTGNGANNVNTISYLAQATWEEYTAP